MASAVKTLLWAWVIGKCVVSPVTIPEITDEAFIDECVRGHNRARSSVRPAASDMLYMVGLTHSFTSSSCKKNPKKTKNCDSHHWSPHLNSLFYVSCFVNYD